MIIPSEQNVKKTNITIQLHDTKER